MGNLVFIDLGQIGNSFLLIYKDEDKYICKYITRNMNGNLFFSKSISNLKDIETLCSSSEFKRIECDKFKNRIFHTAPKYGINTIEYVFGHAGIIENDIISISFQIKH